MQKAFNKISYPFRIKKKNHKNFQQSDKGHLQKPHTANKFKFKALHLRSRPIQSYLFLSLWFEIILGVLTRVVKQEKVSSLERKR